MRSSPLIVLRFSSAPVRKSTSESGVRRIVRNRHRHAIEQASRRWRRGRRRRGILIYAQLGAAARGLLRDEADELGPARRWRHAVGATCREPDAAS